LRSRHFLVSLFRNMYYYLQMRNRMKKTLLILFAFYLISTAGLSADVKSFSDECALRVAHELAGTVFKGWTYGNYSSAKLQLDCTTFISAVADSIMRRSGKDYTAAMRRDVLINHNDLGRNVAQEGPDPDDPRYAGIVHAIEKYTWGSRITEMSEVQPGDFIQYWIRRANGTWFGHASLIETVRFDIRDGHYKARIYGAHKSTNGIAVSSFELLLDGRERLVYIGRIEFPEIWCNP